MNSQVKRGIKKKMSFWALLGAVLVLLVAFLISGCGAGGAQAIDSGKNGGAQVAQSGHGLTDSAPVGIYMLNVGHGDSILIRVGQEYSLMDAGDVKPEARKMLMSELKKHGVKRLKYVIISHPHADHYGGVVAIAKAMPIGTVYDNGQDNPARSFKTYKAILAEKHIPRVTLSEGDVVKLGPDVTFTVFADAFWDKGNGKVKVNNQSLLGKLTYGKFSMLFTGDAEKEEEAYVNKKYNTKLGSTVLKAGHHGSDTSSTVDFLGAVRPSYALVSAGVCDEYNHPRPIALKRIADAVGRFHKDLSHTNTIYRTDEDGTISIFTDGKSYTIETAHPHKETLNLTPKDYKKCKNNPKVSWYQPNFLPKQYIATYGGYTHQKAA